MRSLFASSTEHISRSCASWTARQMRFGEAVALQLGRATQFVPVDPMFFDRAWCVELRLVDGPSNACLVAQLMRSLFCFFNRAHFAELRLVDGPPNAFW